MEQLKIAGQYRALLLDFAEGLKELYRQELVSLVIYGSAVSGEFVERHSNLNLLAVLKDTDLETLKKSSRLVRKFNTINCLFMTEEYIASTTDVFPIEFLDMQENYFVIFGKDILRQLEIDPRNLRFQCEHELKAKLLKLRQAYLMLEHNPSALRGLLFASFTSILHILRNVLRIKGKKPSYLKQAIIEELAQEFGITMPVWRRILAAKNKETKLSGSETGQLFMVFVKELESLAAMVDKL